MLGNKKQKEIRIDGWKLYDLPIKYSEADYEEARKEIIDKAKKTPELIALFEFGLVPAPSISDMDFWAVFPDDSKKMHIPAEPTFSEKTKYLMDHKLLVITEKHYRQMLYFDPWTTYVWPDGHNLLYQRKDIKRDLNFEHINFSQEDGNILNIAFIEEKLEPVYSNLLFYLKKELPIRTLFETIKDCIYIIEEVNLVTGRKIDIAFREEFKNLRKNWFELKQKEAVGRMIKLFYQSLIIGFEAAFSLADWLKDYCQYSSVQDLGIRRTNFLNHSYLNKKAKNIYLNNFKDHRIFTDFVKTPQQALELSLNSYKKLNLNLGKRSKIIDFYIIFQPFEMASLPLGLVSQDGLLSNFLKNDIFTNQEKVPVFKPKVFQEKNKMINEITENYNKKQTSYSDGKGFLFGNNRFGYLFEKEKFRRKILNFWLKQKFWQIINELK